MTRLGSIQSETGKRMMDASLVNGQVMISVLTGKGQMRHEEFIAVEDIYRQIEILIAGMNTGNK